MQNAFIIAHRGARSMAPENTLAAGFLAYKQGAHMWEADVRLTRDFVPVLMHDQSLARTTNVPLRKEFGRRFPWNVCDFDYEELSNLNAGEWYVCADPFGQIAHGEIGPVKLQGYTKERVPALGDALFLTKSLDWEINIEIKEDPRTGAARALAKQLSSLISSMEMTDKVLVSSFSTEVLAVMGEANPNIARGFLFDKISIEKAVDICKDLQVEFMHPSADAITTAQVSHLSDEGFLVNVWTVNELDKARSFLQAGAAGIITDFPLEYFREKSLLKEQEERA